MVLVLLLIPWGRTAGGHGLLEAVPRIYQVTPDIPDRRRATQQDGSQTTDLADSLKESQLAARSGPPPPRRTSPTTRITTASLKAVAASPWRPSRPRCSCSSTTRPRGRPDATGSSRCSGCLGRRWRRRRAAVADPEQQPRHERR